MTQVQGKIAKQKGLICLPLKEVLCWSQQGQGMHNDDIVCVEEEGNALLSAEGRDVYGLQLRGCPNKKMEDWILC